MPRTLASFLIICCLLATPLCAQDGVKSRTFHLHYRVTLTDLKPDQQVRVWLPIATSNDAQDARVKKTSLGDENHRLSRDAKYGNTCRYFALDKPTDEYAIDVEYEVTRREVRALKRDADTSKTPPLTLSQRKAFLSSNRRVPITGKPLLLLPNFGGDSDVLARARMLYEKVDSHVKYDKSKPGYGNGDVLWVCDSRTGNCTDFHSLFISMARSQSIPARFEIGLPLPPERGEGTIGGYHCWAAFHEKTHGWVPVDISEADKHPEMKEYYFGSLTENRVGFTVGRDIILEPRQSGPPLNYFVYPYVEVDGEPLSKEHIKLDFRYRDVK